MRVYQLASHLQIAKIAAAGKNLVAVLQRLRRLRNQRQLVIVQGGLVARTRQLLAR